MPRVLLGLVLTFGLWLAPAGQAHAEPAPSAPAPTVRISVMSLNIFYGGDDYDLRTGDWCPVANGCPQGLRKLARTVRASGADVVGLQEAEGNTRALARLLGWYADPRAQVVSRFPILRPSGGQGLVTYVEPVPGRVVAVANTHLPSSPYGPYKAQRGASASQVMALEQRLRVAALPHVLRVLPKLAAEGIPVFLTGDFNSPSHLDWTPAVAAVRADVPYPVEWPASAALAAAGFVDSYRRVHPDPVADPGFTWTPGSPEGRKDEVPDRIDWVLSAGPASAVASSLVGERGNPQVDVAVPGRFPSDHRGVVSTFDVTAPLAAPTVSPQTRRVLVGDRLRVRYAGARGQVALDGVTVPATGGTVTLPTDSVTPGRHDVVLRDETGHTVASSPVRVYAAGTRPRIATRAASYRPGERIGVRWSAAPGNHLDWVGLFRCARTCDDPGSYLAFVYTHTRVEGSLTLSDHVAPGEGAPPWPLPPGEYVVRLLVDDGYRVAAESPRFRVLAD